MHPSQPPKASRSRPWRYVLEAVLLGAGLGVVLLYVYGLVEAFWLADLPPHKREVARLVRTVAISMTGTVVTAVYVLWRTVPTLRRTLAEGSGAASGGGLARESLSRWFISLRWVALLVLAPVVVVATVGGLVPESSAMPLWIAVAVLFLANTALSLLDPRLRAAPQVFVAQVALDGILLAWLLHHAGGLANPFAGILAFHAVIAGIVLDPRRAKAVIGGLALLVIALTGLEASGALEPACVSGFDGICRHPDELHLLAAGLGTAILVAGCGGFVVALMGAVRRERDQLAIAREELTEEREKLRSIIDCMADAVVFAGPDGQIRLLNHSALALWAEGPPHSGSLRVCHSDATWQLLLAKLAAPGEREAHPLLTVGSRTYEPNYARVLDPQGQLRGVVMVARDVTERLQAQSWRMREERMAVVGKLAAALAHELNNPLGSIALFTQHALKKLPADDPLTEHLETVLRNANQCSKHVRDLLTYARQRPPEQAPLDPARLLADVERTLGPHAERAGARMRVVIHPGTPASMVADAGQLRQVLVNLGLNGIEAMPEGGALTLEAMADGPGDICFAVADEGTGIAPEEREHIFSAFHTTKAEGTGLGLAVAADIARAHGGRIELQSEVGEGSTFRVRLPVGDSVAPKEAVA
jgi:signal transduction histidine kinase